MYYTKEEVREMRGNSRFKNQNLPLVSCSSGSYRDFYKVAIDSETRTNWLSTIQELHREFINYPSAIEWVPPILQHLPEMQSAVSIGTLSKSHNGNFLEAVNLALSEFGAHYVDRDLRHTGQTILVLSAGCGYFEVEKSLAELTKQKIIDNGIACDLVCVARPPFHAVPLFLYQDDFQSKSSNSDSSIDDFSRGHSRSGSQSLLKPQFKFPFWIYISFFVPGEPKVDTLVCNLLQSIHGWQSDYSEATNKIAIPATYLKGSYRNWLSDDYQETQDDKDELSDDSTESSIPQFSLGRHREVGEQRRTPNRGSRVNSDSSYSSVGSQGSSHNQVTPLLTIRTSGLSVEAGTLQESMPKFSFESGNGSVGNSFSKESSFTSVDFVQYGFARSNSQSSASQSVNPFDLSVTILENSSSRRWSHMFPKVTGMRANQSLLDLTGPGRSETYRAQHFRSEFVHR